MFEILGEQIFSEFSGIPNDEARSVVVPRDNVVNDPVINQLICFGQKRRRKRSRGLSWSRIPNVPLHRWRSHLPLPLSDPKTKYKKFNKLSFVLFFFFQNKEKKREIHTNISNTYGKQLLNRGGRCCGRSESAREREGEDRRLKMVILEGSDETKHCKRRR